MISSFSLFLFPLIVIPIRVEFNVSGFRSTKFGREINPIQRVAPSKVKEALDFSFSLLISPFFSPSCCLDLFWSVLDF
jgi:hypothetical protein